MDDARLRQILLTTKKIAIIGLSPKEERPSNMVARYLIDAGYSIYPVNPGKREILGLPCYPSLEAIGGDIDLVNIFRKSEDTPSIVEQAVNIQPAPKCIWLQLGIANSDAEKIGRNAGIPVVMDKCLKIEHQRLC